MSELEMFLEKNKETAIASAIEIENLKAELKGCVNELCLKCGQYKHEHEGACNDCRWLNPRRGW